MKARFSAFLILLANIVILAHAAIPHYHGDDMIATLIHLSEDEAGKDEDQKGHCCHHDGEESQDDGHCLMNDTMMASICREDDSDKSLNATDAGLDLLLIAGVLPCLFAIPEPTAVTAEKPAGADEILYSKEPLPGRRGLRAPPRG